MSRKTVLCLCCAIVWACQGCGADEQSGERVGSVQQASVSNPGTFTFELTDDSIWDFDGTSDFLVGDPNTPSAYFIADIDSSGYMEEFDSDFHQGTFNNIACLNGATVTTTLSLRLEGG